MKETEEIVRAFERLEPGEVAALATVVKVEGSAYRRPGARMLITSSGRTVGAISGGCLESDVCERAQRVIATGEAIVIKYDATADEDRIFGLGMGCNGVTHILIECLEAEDPLGPIRFLSDCSRQRRSGVMATVLYSDPQTRARPGNRLFSYPEGDLTGSVSDFEIERLLASEMRVALEEGRSRLQTWQLGSGEGEAFIEVMPPPVPLIVFGGGYDALPIVRLAKELGWHVTVVDHRLAYASSERFPVADEVICASPDALPMSVLQDERTVAIIMTHHYESDLRLLETLLPRSLRYLGILGPKSRTQRLLTEIEVGGNKIPPEQRERLFGPVGLDLGAETPEEIALSIVAEMQCTLLGRSGGSLKVRSGAIH